MRARCRVLTVLLGTLGCRPEGAPAPVEATEPARVAASEPSDGTALQTDLSSLCQRIAARRISAWSQPMYLSTEVRDLTIQIDQGSETARCELGTLMQARRLRECRETAKNLRESCKR